MPIIISLFKLLSALPMIPCIPHWFLCKVFLKPSFPKLGLHPPSLCRQHKCSSFLLIPMFHGLSPHHLSFSFSINSSCYGFVLLWMCSVLVSAPQVCCLTELDPAFCRVSVCMLSVIELLLSCFVCLHCSWLEKTVPVLLTVYLKLPFHQHVWGLFSVKGDNL